MVAITSVFGANATIDTTDTSNPILKIKWDDVATSISSASLNPDSGEDWLSAILYSALDNLAPLSQSAVKMSLSQGFPSLTTWNSVRVRAYPVTVAFYVSDSGDDRPNAGLY